MIVAFRKGMKNPLLLSHVTIKGGKVESAYVVNGAWEFSRIDGILYVEGDIDSPMEEFQIMVDIPQGYVSDDYNGIIEWARNEALK
ncbi:hypothetical protein UGMREWDR_CDS0086 [Aeromonas phage GomatiRiver_11]|nr:hypothetical protein OBDJBBDK_00079 [Aeromonas phage AhFM11]WKW84253.1 hypothetical protein UGMREWDR_CDS0086 [Aeromonas phage GomatiRiver_11]